MSEGNGIQRDIGGIEARLDAHEVQFKEFRQNVTDGFKSIGDKIDSLTASENRRKGERATWAKIIGGATAVAGIWEIAKAWLHR